MAPLLSHLLTFLGGLLIGIFGNYLSQLLTDKRIRKESKKEENRQFDEIKKIMPKLIIEMKEDLSKPNLKIKREFFVNPNKSVRLNVPSDTLVYYENEHIGLNDNMILLENKGFITDITPGNASKYRMTEEFVELILQC